MADVTCTAEDREAVIRAAQKRKAYLIWLARALLQTDDRMIRREAAAEIRQLVGADV